MAAALAMGATPHALAATKIWTGGGSNNNWSTPGNWGTPGNNATPVPGDALVFGGTTRLSNTLDYGLSVSGITFASGAGAFVLDGIQRLTTTGNITNNSGNLQTVKFAVNVGSDQTWDGGTGGMSFGGPSYGAVNLGSSSLSLVNAVSIYGDAFSLKNQSFSLGSGSKLNMYTGEIGTAAGTTGTVTVTGTGSQWTTRYQLYLGGLTAGSGTGTVNILNSGKVTAEQLFIGSKGSLNLTDGTLQIRTLLGNAGAFNWNSGTLAFMGDAALGTGLLAGTTVLGSGKTLGVANNLTLGTGTSLQVNGGALSAGTLTLDGGTLRTSAAATTGVLNWVKGDLQLTSAAQLGAGILPYALTLGTGKNLGISGDLTVGPGRTLQLSGGSLNLNGSRLTLNGGAFFAPSAANIGGPLDWTLGGLYLTGDAALGAGLLAGQIDVIANMNLNVSTNLTISTGTALSMQGGSLSVKTLTLDGGTFYAPYANRTPAVLNWVKGAITFGEDTVLGNGLLPAATVLGTGKTLNIAKNLTIGNGANLQLAGGTLNAGTLTLDGGTFQTSSASTIGGAFNWIRGALGLTGDAALGTGLLSAATTLGAGKSLSVSSNLTVGAGTTLKTNDAGVLSAGALTLAGGSFLSGSGAIDLSRIGTMAGHGTVSGKLSGSTNKTITAAGGTLSLGDADALGGYAFGGTLDVGGQQVVLLSADKAQLGVTTRLAAGGNLSTVNGANLAAGNTLSFSGDSSIQGHFTNNGSVAGSAGTLSFVSDVDGAGSYAGNVLFKAAFNPGNSPASVSYHGGNVSFDSVSVLTMELLGDTAGTQYDQLVDIHTLSFNGTLKLVFGSGFVPLAGSSFALFGFDNFSGAFGTAANGYERITVTGYDHSKLDFSRLGIDGRLGVASVTPVPEPQTYAMLLAGLGLVGTIVRRRRHAAVS